MFGVCCLLCIVVVCCVRVFCWCFFGAWCAVLVVGCSLLLQLLVGFVVCCRLVFDGVVVRCLLFVDV